MKTLIWNFWFYGLWWINILANGFSVPDLPAIHNIPERAFLAGLAFLTLAGSSGMVIWIGDPNMLYTMPVYFILFLLCTKGDLTGRLAVGVIFFA